ncbi:MAG: alginate O-acetyltransferase [Spirochaetaceae bacterium]|nr:MAG: alginate O-acetyltransferase [Spirochaetaceae bacterium]
MSTGFRNEHQPTPSPHAHRDTPAGFRTANRVLAVVLLGVLATGIGLSLANPALAAVRGLGPLVTGQWAAAYQDQFEEQLPLRDAAVHLWTALRFVLLNEGRHGVLVGQNGWLFTAEEFTVDPDHDQWFQRNLAFLEEVRDTLRDRGIELVVAVVPAKARVLAQKDPAALGVHRLPVEAVELLPRIHAALDALGIPAPDLAVALARSTHAPVFLRTDTHWTPHGARHAAEAVAPSVRRLLDQRDVPPAKFELHPLSAREHRGDLMTFLPLGPFADQLGFPPESVSPWHAEPVDAPVVGLFDEVAIPVTLIGTSYSAGELWSFDAFLRAAASADVLNLAEEGRGPFAPMRDYLSGTVIDEVPPDVVIWEIPERYFATAW